MTAPTRPTAPNTKTDCFAPAHYRRAPTYWPPFLPCGVDARRSTRKLRTLLSFHFYTHYHQRRGGLLLALQFQAHIRKKVNWRGSLPFLENTRQERAMFQRAGD